MPPGGTRPRRARARAQAALLRKYANNRPQGSGFELPPPARSPARGRASARRAASASRATIERNQETKNAGRLVNKTEQKKGKK